MRRLYKATTVMGISTLAGIFIGFLRSKFMALSLGPSGVGILSQAMTFAQTGETLCALGIGLGITKQVSELFRAKRGDGIRDSLYSALVMQGVSFAVFFIAGCFFSRQLSSFLFASPGYNFLLILVSGAVVFSIFTASIESVFLGIGKADIFSKARVIYYASGIFVLVPLVYFFGLKGGFFYILVNAVLGFAVVGYFFLREAHKNNIPLNIPKGLKLADTRKNFSYLMSYSGAILIATLITWLASLYGRSIIIEKLGAEANGYFQVIFGLVSYYTPFLTNGIWGHLFPKLSALANDDLYRVEFNRGIKFMLLFAFPVISIVFMLKVLIVKVLFSDAFLPSVDLFGVYLAGSFFFLINYVFSSSLLARKKVKAYLALSLMQNAAFLFILFFLVKGAGVIAIALAYFLANLLSFIVLCLYHIKKMNMRISDRNKFVFLADIIFSLTVLFMPLGWAIKYMIIGLWFFFVLRKRERMLFIRLFNFGAK